MEVIVKKSYMKTDKNRKGQIKGMAAGMGAALCMLLTG